MKVILTKDVPKVGQRGTLVEVSDGYGRNFLIRQGLARIADAQAITEARAREEKIAHKIALKKTGDKEYQSRLTGATLQFTKKANDRGHLFAAVSIDEALEALHKLGFSEVEKSWITGLPLKATGEHTITVSVGGVGVPVRVIIIAT